MMPHKYLQEKRKTKAYQLLSAVEKKGTIKRYIGLDKETCIYNWRLTYQRWNVDTLMRNIKMPLWCGQYACIRRK